MSSNNPSYGIEQARNQLPSITNQAHEGVTSIITKHGKPYAAIVPVEELGKLKRHSAFLSLRGTGKGLWGDDPSKTIAELRDEWDAE